MKEKEREEKGRVGGGGSEWVFGWVFREGKSRGEEIQSGLWKDREEFDGQDLSEVGWKNSK